MKGRALAEALSRVLAPPCWRGARLHLIGGVASHVHIGCAYVTLRTGARPRVQPLSLSSLAIL